jgi:hypothetical protein
MKKEERKYSPWEYDEQEEEEQPELDENGNPKDPNAEEEEPNKNLEDDYSDDTPVKVKIDGKIVEMTAGELASGYMRQSDYTRKSQEVAEIKKSLNNASPEEKKEVTEKAKEIIDNPGNFSKEDVDTARTLLQIVKGTGLAKEFGLMTKEEFEAEKQREKQVAEFGSKIDTAKTEVGKMKGMPAFNEEEIIDFMQESGIHDPMAAYLRKHDAQYRDFIIKQAKGDTSYKSDKGGKKIEPNEKPINVRTEEGHRSFLADEIKKLKD